MEIKTEVSTSDIHLKISTEEDPTGTTTDLPTQRNTATYRYALIQGDLPPYLSEYQKRLKEMFENLKLQMINSVQDREKLSPVSDGQTPMAIEVIFTNQCQLESNLELTSKSRVTPETPKLILYLLIQSDESQSEKINEEMSSICNPDQWKAAYRNTFLIYKCGHPVEIKSFLNELLNRMKFDAMKQDIARFRCISEVLQELPEIETTRQFQFRNGLEKSFEAAGPYQLDGVLKFSDPWKQGNWHMPIEQVSNNDVGDELQHSECYDTSGVNRVLIINNRNFAYPTRTRVGADFDVENLRDLFQRLRYHVDVRRDLSKAEMMQAVEEFSNPNEPDISSSVLVIMSHGTEGTLQGRDGNDVLEKDLLGIFGSGQHLNRKPRLVVIQACRDYTKPQVTKITGTEEEDVSSMFEKLDVTVFNPVRVREFEMAAKRLGEHYFGRGYVVVDNSPDRAGMIIAHSTLPGDPANRNELKGSRFITALCMAYHANAEKMDVVSMINMVNASMTQVNKEGTPAAKQLASWTIQTTKKYYLARTPQVQKREEKAD